MIDVLAIILRIFWRAMSNFTTVLTFPAGWHEGICL